MNTTPRICASVTSKAGSLGVKMHNAAYKATGADYTYIAISSDNVHDTLSALKTLNFRGLAVSNPFKTEILKDVDVIDNDVKTMGACNTIVNDNGTLFAYNTDCYGAIAAINEKYDILKIKSALIVGCGGVARAIAVGLRNYNIDVYVSARNEIKRKNFIKELDLQGECNIENQDKFNVDLIINATPISDENCPVVIDKHKSAKVLFDVSFSNRNSEIVKIAEDNGMITVSGWRMLLHQGAKQFELYTGLSAPVDVMSKALEDNLPE